MSANNNSTIIKQQHKVKVNQKLQQGIEVVGVADWFHCDGDSKGAKRALLSTERLRGRRRGAQRAALSGSNPALGALGRRRQIHFRKKNSQSRESRKG
jgi:hypothetical protein